MKKREMHERRIEVKKKTEKGENRGRDKEAMKAKKAKYAKKKENESKKEKMIKEGNKGRGLK